MRPDRWLDDGRPDPPSLRRHRGLTMTMWPVEFTTAEWIAVRMAIKDRINFLESCIAAGCSGPMLEALQEAKQAFEKLGG